jgi:hypothetical protein
MRTTWTEICADGSHVISVVAPRGAYIPQLHENNISTNTFEDHFIIGLNNCGHLIVVVGAARNQIDDCSSVTEDSDSVIYLQH